MHADADPIMQFPASIEAEQCVIGSLVLCQDNPALVAEIRSLITAQSFFQVDYQILFESICRLIDCGQPADVITLQNDLERRHLLADVGGVPFLAQALDAVPTPKFGAHYAKIVREKAGRRALMKLGGDLYREAMDSTDPDAVRKLTGMVGSRLAEVQAANIGAESHSLKDILVGVTEQMDAGGIPTVSTGFKELDEVAGGGIGMGEMMVLAACPGMGKSTLAKQIAAQVAQRGEPAGIITLEEGRYKIGRNILSSWSGVNNKFIRNGRVTSEDQKKLSTALEQLSGFPLHVFDSAREIDAVKAAANLLASKHGCRLLVIDYLQRIGGPGKSTYEKVSHVSREISDLFKTLNVAGLVISSLNRDVQKRENKRPIMSDLRESGQIEFDADMIVFLHREDVYRGKEPGYRPKNEAELIIAKNREGERGFRDGSGARRDVMLATDMKTQQFKDRPDPFGNSPTQEDEDLPY